jgi:coenzyme F420 hydrogenase subunit beta
LRALLKEKKLAGPVRKFDVPPPPAQVFQVVGEKGEVEIPLAEVRARTLPGCALCPDMTAELADISVGAAEGRPGWNTILVRTAKGAELLAQARERNLLSLEPAPAASLSHLRQAAQAKRDRASKAQAERTNG